MIACRYIFNSYNSFTVFNSSSVVLTTDINNDITSSVLRHFNSYCERFTFFSFANSNINTSIILRSCDIGCFSCIGMSIVTGVDYFDFVNARSFIVNINNSSAVNNSSIVLMVADFNSHITSSVVTYNNHNSSVALINNSNV